MPRTKGEVGGRDVDGQEPNDLRIRFLERVCARRVVLTVTFALSGMIFVVSVLLVLFADISAESTAIAIVDALLTGFMSVISLVILRECHIQSQGGR